MSRFIETTHILEAPPIFELQSKEIIKPITEKIWKKICDRKYQRRKSDGVNEKKYMNNFYEKLIDEEKQRINLQNAYQIKESYYNLKAKWSKSCEEVSCLGDFFPMKRHNIYTEFRNRRSRLNLKTVYGQMPKKLQLIKKHNNKIMLQFGSTHELQQIRKNKQKYQSWLDRKQNHISKSPIFKNMNKILKEIEQKQTRTGSIPIYKRKKEKQFYQGLSKMKKYKKSLLEFNQLSKQTNIRFRFVKNRKNGSKA